MNAQLIQRKLLFTFSAVAGSLLIFFAALVWQGVLDVPGPIGWVCAILGIGGVEVIIALGYGEIKQKPPKPPKVKPNPQPIMAVPPAPAPEQPPRQLWRQTSGTDLLLQNSHPSVHNGYASEAVNSWQGLRLHWELDGRIQSAEAYNFPLVVGRDASCQIVIASQSVSRRHAQFTYENGVFYLMDLGSSNGTKLNGEKIIGAVPVGNGSALMFGRVNITAEFL